jgi:hypothetical protein
MSLKVKIVDALIDVGVYLLENVATADIVDEAHEAKQTKQQKEYAAILQALTSLLPKRPRRSWTDNITRWLLKKVDENDDLQEALDELKIWLGVSPAEYEDDITWKPEADDVKMQRWLNLFRLSMAPNSNQAQLMLPSSDKLILPPLEPDISTTTALSQSTIGQIKQESSTSVSHSNTGSTSVSHSNAEVKIFDSLALNQRKWAAECLRNFTVPWPLPTFSSYTER